MILPFLIGAGEAIAWALAGAGIGLGAAAVGAAITFAVIGIIDMNTVQEKMRSEGIKSGLVSMVENCSNQITLKDMESDKEITFTGDGISDDIYDRQIIYA